MICEKTITADDDTKNLYLAKTSLDFLPEKQREELLGYSRSLEKELSRKDRIIFELQNVILKTTAELIERRDNSTGRHIDRTQHCLRRLVGFLLEHGIYAEEISKWNIELLVISSQLHDVGKISIKDNILMKPDKLAAEEFTEMKKHCVFGVDIIEAIERNTSESAFLKYAKIFAGSHHEKWDGSGYPLGLSGAAIPLQGRLMAIVDVYDALTSERVYKKAFAHEQSIEIIGEGKGTHFDPLIVEVFLAHERDFGSVMGE
jgi:putative two-component system response regulator